MRQPQRTHARNGIPLVLMLSQAEEAERLRQRWAAREADLQLLTAPGVAEALPHLEEWGADAVVCDLSVLSPEATVWLLPPAAKICIPVIVLVPPGGEEQAASLLAKGAADCVVKAGNYDILLALAVRRALAALPASSAAPQVPPLESSRPARPRLDPEELGTVLRHEINNPLTGILGNSELILASGACLPADVCRRVKTIIELAVRLRNLVRDLEKMISGEEASAKGNLNSALARVEPRATPTGDPT